MIKFFYFFYKNAFIGKKIKYKVMLYIFKKYNCIWISLYKYFYFSPNVLFDAYTTYNNHKIRIISFETSKNNYISIATSILNKKKEINYFIKSYNNRWNVEIYFKHIKNNSSINNIKSHNINVINEIIKSSSINQLIISLIINIYNKHNKTKNAINITTFYNIYSNEMLFKIINNLLTFDDFNKYINYGLSFYIKNNDITISNERYSIMPYTKWHYKGLCKKMIINKNEKANTKAIIKKELKQIT